MLLHDVLMSHVEKASREILLVAPFVKSSVVKDVLRAKQSDVHLHLVTRWRVDEIVRGASDISVYDIVTETDNCSFSLHDTVHAKYYRADDAVLLGSANLTKTALGQVGNALEIMERWSGPPLVEFEERLLSGIRQVDETEYEELKHLTPDPVTSLWREGQMESGLVWMPTFRNPKELWEAYTDESYPEPMRTIAVSDLGHFRIPTGLKEEKFNQFVAAAIGHEEIVRELRRFLGRPRRFGEVRRWVSGYVPGPEATSAAQTLMRWVTTFRPHEFEFKASPYSEVLRRVGE